MHGYQSLDTCREHKLSAAGKDDELRNGVAISLQSVCANLHFIWSRAACIGTCT